MNVWLLAATVLLFGLIPCGMVCLWGRTMARLVALEMAGIVTTLVLLLLAQGFHRAPYFDVALALALTMLIGTLAFVRFMERWL